MEGAARTGARNRGPLRDPCGDRRVAPGSNREKQRGKGTFPRRVGSAALHAPERLAAGASERRRRTARKGTGLAEYVHVFEKSRGIPDSEACRRSSSGG